VRNEHQRDSVQSEKAMTTFSRQLMVLTDIAIDSKHVVSKPTTNDTFLTSYEVGLV